MNLTIKKLKKKVNARLTISMYINKRNADEKCNFKSSLTFLILLKTQSQFTHINQIPIIPIQKPPPPPTKSAEPDDTNSKESKNSNTRYQIHSEEKRNNF